MLSVRYGTCFPLWVNKNPNQIVAETLPHYLQKYFSRKTIHRRLCSWCMTHGTPGGGRTDMTCMLLILWPPPLTLTEKLRRQCARLCQRVQKGMMAEVCVCLCVCTEVWELFVFLMNIIVGLVGTKKNVIYLFKNEKMNFPDLNGNINTWMWQKKTIVPEWLFSSYQGPSVKKERGWTPEWSQ